jgi:hypothetical protein
MAVMASMRRSQGGGPQLSGVPLKTSLSKPAPARFPIWPVPRPIRYSFLLLRKHQ